MFSVSVSDRRLLHTTIVVAQEQRPIGATPIPGSVIFADSFETLPEVVSCGAPPAGVTGQCAVNSGSDFLLIRSHVATPNQLLQNAEVLIDASGVIACTGCSCANASGYAGATTLSCPEVLTTPGFINSHEHVTFQTPPVDHGAVRFDHRHDWRIGTGGHSAVDFPSSAASTATQALWGEVRQLLGGTTSMIGSGSAPGVVRNLDRGNARDGLAGNRVDIDTFPLGDSRGELISSGCGYPDLASPNPDQAYLAHLVNGVGTEARNEWECSASAWPAESNNLPGGSLVGAIALQAEDVTALAGLGASVVWSPRHDLSLYGMTTPVTTLANAGVPLALGTSWSATGSLNMLREFACASDFNQTHLNNRFSDRDLFKMATTNAANGAGVGDQLGSVAAGFVADLTLFDASIYSGLSAALVANSEDIVLVLKAGVPLFGAASMLEAMGFGDGVCELMGNVVPGDCLSSHRICLGDATLNYAELRAEAQANPGLVDLYLCAATPSNERSCQPLRAEGDGIEYSGTTLNDTDGDGVPNETDNCPDIFNPVRPVDEFIQSDADNDGVVDACDSEG